MQMGFNKALKVMLLLVLMAPGLIASFPGQSNAWGFGEHAVQTNLVHEGHSHSHSDFQRHHEHHDASTHSHETPNRPELFFLSLSDMLIVSAVDYRFILSLGNPDPFERPPKQITPAV